jgi:hypothetical protein
MSFLASRYDCSFTEAYKFIEKYMSYLASRYDCSYSDANKFIQKV